MSSSPQERIAEHIAARRADEDDPEHVERMARKLATRLTREEATNIIRSIFRRCGYCVAEHGTRGRDLDLVAVPWTERAGEPELIVEDVLETLPAIVLGEPEEKPHGRVAWAIQPVLSYRHDTWYVDLSVVRPR